MLNGSSNWSVNEMPITFKFDGLEEMAESLNAIGANSDVIASAALYQGAGVIADAISASIKNVGSEPFHYAGPGETRLPSPEEVAAIQNARHGIAKFNHTGFNVNTSIGFQNSGYVNIKGRSVPVPLIANAIESGTSFMPKQPFIRKAVNSSKGKAVAVMNAVIQQSIEGVLNGFGNGSVINADTIESYIPKK